jgi:polyisoprenoid-binding protein YceI
MRRPALIASLALAIAAVPMIGAQSQGSPPAIPGAADPARVSAGSYATDPAHTLVGWKVSHFGFNDYFGQFGTITGTLHVRRKA